VNKNKAQIDTQVISQEDPKSISTAIRFLQSGGLVAFPTDTIYGLATPVMNNSGIIRLFEAKGRSTNKAIAVLIGGISQLDSVADLLPRKFDEVIGRTSQSNSIRIAMRLAEVFWPGPLTLIFQRHTRLPNILSPRPTIGVRMPDHPFVLGILNEIGPLATTSANISDGPNPSTAQDVLTQLGNRIELIIDGKTTPNTIGSTVVDCTGLTPTIIRRGPISEVTLKQYFE
jgi:L-threonylcarbamoyladenylate synthase